MIFLGITNFSFTQNKIESLQKKLNKVSEVKDQIAILDTLTTEMVRNNHPEQNKFLNKIVLLSKENDNYDLAAEKSRFIIQAYTNKGQLDSALYVIESMLKGKPKFKKKSSEAHLLLKRASYYYNNEKLDKAVQDYDVSANLFLESKDSIFAADARFFAGQAYFDINDFLKSVKRFEEAYFLYDTLGDKDYANYALNELSSLYGKNGFHDKAIYERKRILQDAKSSNNWHGIFYAYSHLFTSFYKKNQIGIAKKYLDSMVISQNKIENERGKRESELHVSKMFTKYYLKTNNLDSASIYLKEFENKLKIGSNSAKYNRNAFLLYSARFAKQKKNYIESQRFYEQLLDKNNRVGDLQMLINANKEISEVLAAQNKFGESYKYLKNFSDLKEPEDSRIKTNTFLYYQSEFETQRKDAEIFKKKTQITLLEKDRTILETNRNLLRVVLLSVILLSIVIGYFIWLKGKLKRKALAKKLEKNKQELKEFTQQLLEKSKVQESLTKELEKLKEEIGEQKSIEKIHDLTTTRILTPDDWYLFKEKFSQVHPTFFVRLKNKGYKLTKSEERLLAMEKLYLDTKQIASMLAISNDSVVRSRSRLRKKINAPKGSSILEYLEAS